MRSLIERNAPRLPLMDCEIASYMIRLCERKPRQNRHVRRVTMWRVLVVVAMGGGILAIDYVLAVLLLAW